MSRGSGDKARDTDARRRLRDGAAALGVQLGEDALEALLAYLGELAVWNQRLNLVGEHDEASLIDRHLVDALAAVPVLAPLGHEARLADLGSGAGLPGIPLALALRPREMLLVEPRQKRASFLRAAARRLPGFGLRIVEGTAEQLAGQEPGQLDAVVSRATLPEEELLDVAARLLRPGGLVVSYRGTAPPVDVSSDAFNDADVRRYELPGARRRFTLLVRERRFT